MLHAHIQLAIIESRSRNHLRFSLAVYEKHETLCSLDSRLASAGATRYRVMRWKFVRLTPVAKRVLPNFFSAFLSRWSAKLKSAFSSTRSSIFLPRAEILLLSSIIHYSTVCIQLRATNRWKTTKSQSQYQFTVHSIDKKKKWQITRKNKIEWNSQIASSDVNYTRESMSLQSALEQNQELLAAM